MNETYPAEEWERVEPGAVGIDRDRLEQAQRWFDAEAGDKPYRVVIVREGRIAAEWNKGIAPDRQQALASATKSLYSCMLGMAVAEGSIYREADVEEAQNPVGHIARACL